MTVAPVQAGAGAGLLAEAGVDPALLLAVGLAASGYLIGVRAARAWPARRTAAFLTGLVVVAIALGSGLDARADELLSIHMIQHMALTMVAAPLIVLGAPVTLTLRALSPSARRPLARLVTSPAARLVTRPVVAWSLFAAVTIGTHLSPLYDAALVSAPLHALEHALYVSTAVLFWLPLIGADPVRARPGAMGRIAYLMFAMAPMALVGVHLASTAEVRYLGYLGPAEALGVSALDDQHAAGLLMWIGGKVIMVAAVLLVGWAALAGEERRQRARESYAAERVGRTARGAAGGAG